MHEPRFDLLGISKPLSFKLPKIKSPLKWLDNTILTRQDIKKIFPWAKSIIIVGLYYNTDFQKALSKHPDYMSISKYAILRDYHKIIPKKLKNLIKFLKTQHTIFKYKIHSDSFPVFEKGYAIHTLGGTIGYNNLWHSPLGTFILLGGAITDIPPGVLEKLLIPDIKSYRRFIYQDSPFYNPFCSLPHAICPSCNMCKKACPTKALTPFFRINKCIGYFTAEHKGKIPKSIQQKMKNILFGCDICQDICTYNKLINIKLNKKQLEKRFGKVINRAWHISVLKRMSAHGFYKAFSGTPVIRMRYYKFKDRVKTYIKTRKN